MAQLYPQAMGSLFVASYDSQGYGGGIRTRRHTGLLLVSGQSHVTTDGQSAGQTSCQAPSEAPRPDTSMSLSDSCGLVDVGALSDERTGHLPRS
jgi:hypothetical protein